MNSFIVCTVTLVYSGRLSLHDGPGKVKMEEGRSTFKIVTGKPTGKRSLGKFGRAL